MDGHYPLVRTLVGALLLTDLVCFAPAFGTFFGPEYQPHRLGRAPFSALVFLLWLPGALGVTLGVLPLFSALILLGVFRWLFVESSWLGIFEAAAVGMVSYFSVFYLVLFELALRLDPSHAALRDLRWMLRVDLASIMLCAGSYKLLTGYLHGEGISLGLVNPAWGRFHALARRLAFGPKLRRVVDVAGPVGELAAGVLLLVSATQSLGVLVFMTVFGFLSVLLRLGRLSLLLMAMALLLLPPPRVPSLPLDGPDFFSSILPARY